VLLETFLKLGKNVLLTETLAFFGKGVFGRNAAYWGRLRKGVPVLVERGLLFLRQCTVFMTSESSGATICC